MLWREVHFALRGGIKYTETDKLMFFNNGAILLANHFQQKFMDAAIEEARMAMAIDEVPIGAVVVYHDRIIGRGHNLTEHYQHVSYHAEMMALDEACTTMHSWRLPECDLYVTLEPCIMCSGAIINSRINHLYFGASDPKAGAVQSLYHLLDDQRLNHQVKVTSGVDGEQCSQLLKNFFRQVRRRKKAEKRARRQGRYIGRNN